MADIKQQLRKSAHLIEKSNCILIVPDQSLDKKTLEATLSVFSFLQNTGKKADVLNISKNSALNNYPAISDIADERAFIIKINTKEKPPNQLEYEIDKNQIKIIIDSKKENFSPKDVSFEYTPSKYNLIISIYMPNFETLGEIFSRNNDFFTQTPAININDNHLADFTNKDFSW